MNETAPASEQRNDALHAIATRRSIYTFENTPASEADPCLALEMAVPAPNHRLTQSWRFAVFICVGVSPQLDRLKVVEDEEVQAVAVAMQNLTLALHARHIGSLWTTGALFNAPEIRAFLGWSGPHDRVLGVLHVGYATSTERRPPRRADYASHTTWHR